MSDNTKQILAITLGTLGLVIGVFATIVAYNAKNAVSSNTEVTRLVDQRFAEAQARQDELEKTQASDAEKFVASLDKGEKNLIGKINSNTNSITQLQKQNQSLGSQVSSLNQKTDNLSTQVANLQTQVQKNFSTLNNRIDQTNQKINNQGGGANP